MRVFESGSWGDKVNFVDENNVLVGYDLDQSCCEDADWFISSKVEHDKELEFSGEFVYPEGLLDKYSFDVSFKMVGVSDDNGWLDDGEMVAFKLIAEGLPNLYLHLFNVHNGYYSHGFIYDQGGGVTVEGSL